MKGVKCLKCNQRDATIKMVRVLDGKAHSVYFCEQCAAEASPFQKKALWLKETIEKVLGQLGQGQGASEAEKQEAGPGLICPSCGTTFVAYLKSFRLGCSQCYHVFKGLLEPQLKRLHGSAQHVGRRPEEPPRPFARFEATIQALAKELDRAVSAEDFEKAARLRDRIRHLRGELDHVLPKMSEM